MHNCVFFSTCATLPVDISLELGQVLAQVAHVILLVLDLVVLLATRLLDLKTGPEIYTVKLPNLEH